MKGDAMYKIIDEDGNVLDSNLSYEEALMYIEDPNHEYIMEEMK